MEIIATILLLVAICGYFKFQDVNASNHCNTYEVDWGKVNEDRIMNNLSQSQVNKNISSGKYDTGRKWK